MSNTNPLGEDPTPAELAASSPAPVDVAALAARLEVLEAELRAERAAKATAASPQPPAPVAGERQGPQLASQAAGRPLPPFKPWRVAPLIEARLKKIDQHVALIIARHTPQNGTLPLRWGELEAWTGWSLRALRDAAVRIRDAGLITWTGDHQGVIITWTAAAYESVDVGTTHAKR